MLPGQIQKKVNELVEEQLLQQQLYEKEQKKKQGMINSIFKAENNLNFFSIFSWSEEQRIKDENCGKTSPRLFCPEKK